MTERIRLAVLRMDLPAWEWRAERSGWGWDYRGTRDQRTVRIHAVASWVGPSDEDWVTQWLADDGATSKQYAAFWLEERS